MEVLKLKAVNSKMLAENKSSVQCIDAEMHRLANAAYCGFDIVSSFEQKRNRTKHKERTRHRDKSGTKEKVATQSVLSKKIEDLTARNAKIKELLETDVSGKTSINEKHGKASPNEKHSREHKERHTSNKRVRSHDKSAEPKCEILHATVNNATNTTDKETTKSNTEDSSLKEQKSKHKSRRDRCENRTGPDEEKRSSKTNSKVGSEKDKHSQKSSADTTRTRKEKHRSVKSQIKEEPETSEKLLASTSPKNIITVYKNKKTLVETDSNALRDIANKSRRRMRSCDYDYGLLYNDIDKNEVKGSKLHKKRSISIDPRRQLSTHRTKDFEPIDSLETNVNHNELALPNAIVRKELSFSNLNLLPDLKQYEVLGKGATTQTSVSRICTSGYDSRSVNVNESDFDPKTEAKSVLQPRAMLSKTSIALRDLLQVKELEMRNQALGKHRYFFANQMFTDAMHTGNDFINRCPLTFNSNFHKTRAVSPYARTMEASSKMLNNEQISFTVEGIEPPKRLHNSNNSARSLRVQNVFNMHLCPGIPNAKINSFDSIAATNSCPSPIITYDDSIYKKNPLSKYIGNSGENVLDKLPNDCKPKSKEPSEVSYKVRKKTWSNRELQKRSSKFAKDLKLKKDKQRKRSRTVYTIPIVSREAGIQTDSNNFVNVGVMAHGNILRRCNDTQTIKSDIGTGDERSQMTRRSTQSSHETQIVLADMSVQSQQSDKVSKKIQVNLPDHHHHGPRNQVRRISKSESNITMTEIFLQTHDYGTSTELDCPNQCTTTSPPFQNNKVRDGLASKSSTSNETKTPPIDKEISESLPIQSSSNTSVIPIKSRKYSHSCSRISHNNVNSCNLAMSTGSIKNIARTTRKLRSRSLCRHRDSLVEKINFNKETILYHNQEIAALEKCLTEILHHLVPKESGVKEGDTLKNDHKCAVKSLGSGNKGNKHKTMHNCLKENKNIENAPLSKFQRGKAYVEKLRQRAKNKSALASKNSSCLSLKTAKNNLNVSPQRVRSVYKNNRGFVSSATSLSSKISDFADYSSSVYEESALSINSCGNWHHKTLDVLKNSSSSEQKRRRNIVKKKHVIRKKQCYSQKKNGEISNMLKRYIDLTKSSTHNQIHTTYSQMEGDDKIVVLSVSSAKVRHMKFGSYNSDVMADSLSSLTRSMPKDYRMISKEPFYINKNLNKTRTTDVTSVDSLDVDGGKTNAPNLCPLTAMFNFQPKQYAYLVYNTEVITPKKPETEQSRPGPSRVRSLIEIPKKDTILPPSTNPIATTPIPEEKITIPQQPQQKSSPMKVPIMDEEPTALTPKKSLIDREKTYLKLSPVFNRVVSYPPYADCLDILNDITDDLPLPIKSKHHGKLTSFNCNDNECSQFIFNYTSKKDKNSCSPSLKFNTTFDTLIVNTDTKMFDNTSITALRGDSFDGKKMNGFKNFFKKRTLLDVFKSKAVKKYSTAGVGSGRALESTRPPVRPKEDDDEIDSASKTSLWFNFRKKKREQLNSSCSYACSSPKNASTGKVLPCQLTCEVKPTKCINTMSWRNLIKKECPCQLPFEKQKQQCQKYATKVLMESARRNESYKKQYENFKEMPLDDLISQRNCKCKEMSITCPRSFANKVVGIQVKQSVKDEPIQVVIKKQESPIMVPILEPPEEEEEFLITQSESAIRSTISTESPQPEEEEAAGATEVSGQSRCLTDKEIFEKLLSNYERKDHIAARLCRDDEFFNEQIASVQGGYLPLPLMAQERSARQDEERLRNQHFNERPQPLQVINADTTVKPDDIGTCFARGFRPDNLMLSGDACFHINKQDKVKMSPYMLKSTESFIDFSERETPLDFLLALGFMVDEASNALKDDDVRSRLLAAITEARVWINKITTAQGTLLYLVAYKARPETMRYFLQLVEAIINKRINSAVRLDGFLRVLEDVEAGRLQMINILGEDRFEDEENEEKIVRNQIQNLFDNIYVVAQKETAAIGRELTPKQVSLLRTLVTKYRAGLHPHLELIARYIGQGLLSEYVQLEAAMIYLSRLDSAEVKLKEFENYCGITCELHETA